MVATERAVLLVDDSDADSEATTRFLNRSSAQPAVHRCADGAEALEFLRRRAWIAKPDHAFKPGVVLLDLNLPGRDGRDVLEEIKRDEKLKHIPVVILTTSKDQSDVRYCYRHGASGYMIKPLDLKKFSDAVQEFCNYWFGAVELPLESGN